MKPVVWFTEPSLSAHAKAIAAGKLTFDTHGEIVSSLEQWQAATRQGDVVSFVDQHALAALENQEKVPGTVIAVCTSTLPNAVSWLQPHPWLGHVVSAAMLEHPRIQPHINKVLATAQSDKPRLLDWIGPDAKGRRIRLSHASRRAERLERMTDYFKNQGVSGRNIELLRDSAEELLTNAFYDAPVTAGAFAEPISRELDVELPDKYACDLAYGVQDDLSIVRVRDPFGSLSRRRLVEVLSRCARTDMQVEVDESMGGAGLGMWRIFSAATFVAVSVVKHSLTEILVGIARRTPGPRPFAFHLYFRDAKKRRFWGLLRDESIRPSLNHSVLLELKSES